MATAPDPPPTSGEALPVDESFPPHGSPLSEGGTLERDKVSMPQKLAYGVGDWPNFFGNQMVKNLSMPVYNMTLGVDPALLGLCLGIPRIWDAFTDPLMGSISDNFHSRYGRRRPFIFIGAILMGLSFGLIWMVPEHWGQGAQLGYFLATCLIFYTCFTIYSVPLNSLGYEMTPDYDERTRVMAVKSFFGKVGEFLYQWIFPLTTLAVFASVIEGVRIVSWIVAIVIFAGVGVLPAIFVKERYYQKAQAQKKVPLFKGVRDTLRNKPFLVIITIMICNILSGMVASGVDYYLIVYYMFDGDIAKGSVWKAVLSSGYAVVGIAAIYPIGKLATKFSKRRALIMVYSLVVVGGIVKWFVFTPGMPWLILLDPLFCGPIYTAIGMIIASMLADICDDDELKTGARREGSFGSVYTWIMKSGVSLAFFGTGIALNVSGFDAKLGGDQAPGAILALRCFLVGATVSTALAAIVLLRFYPITRTSALETRRLLEERRGLV